MTKLIIIIILILFLIILYKKENFSDLFLQDLIPTIKDLKYTKTKENKYSVNDIFNKSRINNIIFSRNLNIVNNTLEYESIIKEPITNSYNSIIITDSLLPNNSKSYGFFFKIKLHKNNKNKLKFSLINTNKHKESINKSINSKKSVRDFNNNLVDIFTEQQVINKNLNSLRDYFKKGDNGKKNKYIVIFKNSNNIDSFQDGYFNILDFNYTRLITKCKIDDNICNINIRGNYSLGRDKYISGKYNNFYNKYAILYDNENNELVKNSLFECEKLKDNNNQDFITEINNQINNKNIGKLKKFIYKDLDEMKEINKQIFTEDNIDFLKKELSDKNRFKCRAQENINSRSEDLYYYGGLDYDNKFKCFKETTYPNCHLFIDETNCEERVNLELPINRDVSKEINCREYENSPQISSQNIILENVNCEEEAIRQSKKYFGVIKEDFPSPIDSQKCILFNDEPSYHKIIDPNKCEINNNCAILNNYRTGGLHLNEFEGCNRARNISGTKNVNKKVCEGANPAPNWWENKGGEEVKKAFSNCCNYIPDKENSQNDKCIEKYYKLNITPNNYDNTVEKQDFLLDKQKHIKNILYQNNKLKNVDRFNENNPGSIEYQHKYIYDLANNMNCIKDENNKRNFCRHLLGREIVDIATFTLDETIEKEAEDIISNTQIFETKETFYDKSLSCNLNQETILKSDIEEKDYESDIKYYLEPYEEKTEYNPQNIYDNLDVFFEINKNKNIEVIKGNKKKLVTNNDGILELFENTEYGIYVYIKEKKINIEVIDDTRQSICYFPLDNKIIENSNDGINLVISTNNSSFIYDLNTVNHVNDFKLPYNLNVNIEKK